MVTSVAYLWLFLNIRTHNAVPGLFSAFVLGALIALGIAFFINNFKKISLHAVGMGGLFIAVFNIIITNGRAYTSIPIYDNYSITIHSIFLMTIIMVVIGAVLTSRLYLRAHTIQDVSGGILVGIVGQLIALNLF